MRNVTDSVGRGIHRERAEPLRRSTCSMRALRARLNSDTLRARFNRDALRAWQNSDGLRHRCSLEALRRVPLTAVLGALLLFAGFLILAQSAYAQDDSALEPAPTQLVPEELEELVGPIALYPDDLVSIVLPASTYPLQIVQAARFLEERKTNSNLEPSEDWDDSVVALLNYPEVLQLMNDDLDWTWALGEAVLAQRADVLEAIQSFRDRAYAAGNLRSDDRQVVRREEDVISIAPADPEVIYVPYYEPRRVVVYQSVPVYHYYPWPYPVYYYPYPVGYSFRWGYFWGVTSFFSIGWHTHFLHVHHHHYHGHPYYGWSYYDPFYVRRAPYVTVNINHVHNVWQPRYRHGARPNTRVTRSYGQPAGRSSASIARTTPQTRVSTSRAAPSSRSGTYRTERAERTIGGVNGQSRSAAPNTNRSPAARAPRVDGGNAGGLANRAVPSRAPERAGQGGAGQAARNIYTTPRNANAASQGGNAAPRYEARTPGGVARGAQPSQRTGTLQVGRAAEQRPAPRAMAAPRPSAGASASRPEVGSSQRTIGSVAAPRAAQRSQARNSAPSQSRAYAPQAAGRSSQGNVGHAPQAASRSSQGNAGRAPHTAGRSSQASGGGRGTYAGTSRNAGTARRVR